MIRPYVHRAVLVLGLSLVSPLYLSAATSSWLGPGANFGDGANWSNGAPTDDAGFNTAAPLSISVGADATLNSFTFNTGASAYTFSIASGKTLSLNGTGIVNNSSHAASFTNAGFILLKNASSLGNSNIETDSAAATDFFNTASAGTGIYDNKNGGGINFADSTTAAQSNITNEVGSYLNFLNGSTAGAAHVTSSGLIGMSGTATLGTAVISNNSGLINVTNSASLDHATITNTGTSTINFADSATAGNATIYNNDSGGVNFGGSSTAGNATITNDGAGTSASQNATLGNAIIVINNAGGMNLTGNASAGNAIITSNDGSNIAIVNTATAGNATFITNDNSFTGINGHASGGNATFINVDTGETDFYGHSHMANATIDNEGGSFMIYDFATGDNATIINNNGDVDITGLLTGGTTFGSIAGSGFFEIDGQTLTVGGNNTSTEVSGEISGDGGSLTKVGLGTLTLSGNDSYDGLTTVSAGTLNLTGSLAGDALVEPGAFFTGTGNLQNLTNNGSVTPGSAGSGKLTTTGYSGTGTLNINVSGNSFTKLVVNGNANLSGGTLNVTGGNFVLGNYDIVTAQSVTGTFAQVITPDSAFLSFTPRYTSTDVLLLIGLAAKFQSVAQSPNQQGVATIFDGSGVGASSDFTHVLNAVALLSATEARAAYDQLSGDSLPSLLSTNIRAASAFVDQMAEREGALGIETARLPDPVQLAYLGDAQDFRPVASGNSSYGLWSRGVGYFDRIRADSAIGSPGSHSSTGGFQAGYDTLYGRNLLVGLSGGYSRTSLSVDNRAASAASETVLSGIYARYEPSAWYLNGLASFSGARNTTSRTVDFPGVSETASANFTSRVYTGALTTGYRYSLHGRTTLEPIASFRVSRLEQDAYTETGAPGLNLQMDEQTQNSYVSTLGGRISRTFNPASGHPSRLGFESGWRHELGSVSNQLSARFADDLAGGAFIVAGTPRQRNAAVLSFDARCGLLGGLEGVADYTAILSSSETSQAIWGGLIFTWK